MRAGIRSILSLISLQITIAMFIENNETSTVWSTSTTTASYSWTRPSMHDGSVNTGGGSSSSKDSLTEATSSSTWQDNSTSADVPTPEVAATSVSTGTTESVTDPPENDLPTPKGPLASETTGSSTYMGNTEEMTTIDSHGIDDAITPNVPSPPDPPLPGAETSVPMEFTETATSFLDDPLQTENWFLTDGAIVSSMYMWSSGTDQDQMQTSFWSDLRSTSSIEPSKSTAMTTSSTIFDRVVSESSSEGTAPSYSTSSIYPSVTIVFSSVDTSLPFPSSRRDTVTATDYFFTEYFVTHFTSNLMETSGYFLTPPPKSSTCTCNGGSGSSESDDPNTNMTTSMISPNNSTKDPPTDQDRTMTTDHYMSGSDIIYTSMLGESSQQMSFSEASIIRSSWKYHTASDVRSGSSALTAEWSSDLSDVDSNVTPTEAFVSGSITSEASCTQSYVDCSASSTSPPGEMVTGTSIGTTSTPGEMVTGTSIGSTSPPDEMVTGTSIGTTSPPDEMVTGTSIGTTSPPGEMVTGTSIGTTSPPGEMVTGTSIGTTSPPDEMVTGTSIGTTSPPDEMVTGTSIGTTSPPGEMVTGTSIGTTSPPGEMVTGTSIGTTSPPGEMVTGTSIGTTSTPGEMVTGTSIGTTSPSGEMVTGTSIGTTSTPGEMVTGTSIGSTSPPGEMVTGTSIGTTSPPGEMVTGTSIGTTSTPGEMVTGTSIGTTSPPDEMVTGTSIGTTSPPGEMVTGTSIETTSTPGEMVTGTSIGTTSPPGEMVTGTSIGTSSPPGEMVTVTSIGTTSTPGEMVTGTSIGTRPPSDDLPTVFTTESTSMLPTRMPAVNFSVVISRNETRTEGGQSILIDCHVSEGLNATIVWSRNGVPIKNSTRRYSEQYCSLTYCKSCLHLIRVDPVIHAGNYQCSVGSTTSGNHMVIVYQKPRVTISPVRLSVLEGSYVNITCSVINDDDIYQTIKRNFTWCTPGLRYKVTREDNFLMQISFSLPENATSLTVSCGYHTCTQNATLDVFTNDTASCPQEKRGGFTWLMTKSGASVEQRCADGFVGVVTRTCKDDGVWQEPDLTNCVKKQLQEIADTINGEPLGELDIIDSVLNNVQSFVNTSEGDSYQDEQLSQNTVVHTAEILKNISEAINVKFADKDQAEKTTKTFIDIASNLLSDDKRKRLVDDGKKTNTAKNIIQSINNIGDAVAGGIKQNEVINIKQDNIVVSIQRTPPKAVQFPETGNAISDEITKFELEKETIQHLNQGQAVAFTAVKYTSLGSLLDSLSNNGNSNTTVNSEILSLSIYNVDTSHLSPPINLTFKTFPTNVSDGLSSKCSFLNLNKSIWEFRGCKTLRLDAHRTSCSCNHLTNFAILLSPVDAPGEYERLRLISFVGCSLSIAGAVLTIAVYLHFWRYIKSRRSVLIVNLCFALSGAYLVFLVAVEHSEIKELCIAIAALLHYLFLSIFCLMLSIGIDLFIAIIQVHRSRSSSVLLLLLGWGAPVLIVGVTMGSTQLEGYGDERFCWLRQNTLYGFIVPVMVVILINIVIVIIVMNRMFSTNFIAKKSTKQKTITGVRSMAALLPVLGLTWLFGVLSVNTDTIFFQYLFSICNSVQGLFIFIFHCVLNLSIRKAFNNTVRRYDSKYKRGIQKTSTQKIASGSSSEIRLNSDESANVDLIFYKERPVSSFLPRFRTSFEKRYQSDDKNESSAQYNAHSSNGSEWNTSM